MSTEQFSLRRYKLLSILETPVVVPAHTTMQRKGDAAFTFNQEPNFWYLTGIDEPDWWLIMHSGRTYLVQPELSDVQRLFEGGMSADEVKMMSGVDTILDSAQGIALVKSLSQVHKRVATIVPDPYNKHYGFAPNPASVQMTRRLKRLFNEVVDCRLELAKLRAIKHPTEIDAISRAVDLTTATFESVKQKLSGLQFEYEIEAEFSYAFRRSGATGHAYDPIVAGGAHACTLHYGLNQDELPANGLVLVDIGARVDGYAADITRTYAIGTASQRQTDVHSAVESAHKKIIALLEPGLEVIQYHKSVDTIMQDALIDLGLLLSRDDTATYRKYFPHAVSHGLGIDVHDSLGRPTKFQPGMVLTVEPGIYIPEESIGVRIEDDILITDSGHINLSGALDTSL